MKMQFLAGNKQPLPLVRFFDYRPDEINLLRKACLDLAEGKLKEFALHEQPWVHPIDSCRFYWRASTKDIGVRLPDPGEPIVLEYSDEAWGEVEAKLVPFVVSRPNTFNWLTMEGDVDVLISMDGGW